MRIAALDLGSNSFHLVVAEAHPDGTFTPTVREKEMLRLGEVVTSTGIITAQAADAVLHGPLRHDEDHVGLEEEVRGDLRIRLGKQGGGRQEKGKEAELHEGGGGARPRQGFNPVCSTQS